MRANRAYDLVVHRQGRFFRPSDAIEQVEVIEIDTGEVILFWDTRPRDTGKLARALRADLAQLEADEFLAKWSRYQPHDPAAEDLLTTRPYGAAESDIAALEGEIGRPLPPDVRAFLLVSDGSEWTKFPVLGVQVHAVATMLGLWRVNRGAARPRHRRQPRALLSRR